MAVGFAALVLALAAASPMASALTTQQKAQADSAIRTGIIQQGLIVPTAVRLTFHDCVGGCDGCLNLNNAANAGLSDLVNAIEPVYAGFADVMSRADFWVLVANQALERSIRDNNALCAAGDTACLVAETPIPFKSGRVDCTSASAPETDDVHEFPEPTMSRTQMFDYYANTDFGFTAAEVVALMGAHTLGGADPANSGYSGSWVADEASIFNNHFYGNLLSTSLIFKNFPNLDVTETIDRKWQWNLRDSDVVRQGMMLNTDMELAFDVDVDSVAGSTCTLGAGATCPEASTITLCREYEADQALWVTDFTAVYTKMQENGYADGDLTLVA